MSKYSAGTDISTASSGVTLSVVSTLVNPEVYSLTATNGTASTGSRVFGYEAGVFPDSWSSPNVAFRADFAAPTNFFSIDAIANDFFDPVQVLIDDSRDNNLRFGVVPEPATLLLFGIGLVGAAAVRRRRRRAQ